MRLIRHPGSASGPERRSAWRVLLPAAVGLVLATPVVTWWLIGPLNTAPARVGLDYAFRPWPISPAVTRAAGFTAAVLAVVSLTVLISAITRRLLDMRWWAVLLPLLAAGFIAGAGWRVMTAGVLGSNIGAGLWPCSAGHWLRSWSRGHWVIRFTWLGRTAARCRLVEARRTRNACSGRPCWRWWRSSPWQYGGNLHVLGRYASLARAGTRSETIASN